MIFADLFNTLSKKYKDALTLSEPTLSGPSDTGASALVITSDQLVPLLQELKVDYGFEMLMLLSAVDYPDRYEMNYRLMSLTTAELITVKVNVSKTVPKVASISTYWPAANVQEREVFDMFGIIFEGHPNLKRILNPDDYTEFPLRKTFLLESIDRQSKELLMKGQVL